VQANICSHTAVQLVLQDTVSWMRQVAEKSCGECQQILEVSKHYYCRNHKTCGHFICVSCYNRLNGKVRRTRGSVVPAMSEEMETAKI